MIKLIYNTVHLTVAIVNLTVQQLFITLSRVNTITDPIAIDKNLSLKNLDTFIGVLNGQFSQLLNTISYFY